jgi:hypothetical protein
MKIIIEKYGMLFGPLCRFICIYNKGLMRKSKRSKDKDKELF